MSFVIAHRRNEDGDIVESGVFDTEADDTPEWVTAEVSKGKDVGTADEPSLPEWESPESLSPMTKQIIERPFLDGSGEDEVVETEDAPEDDGDEAPVSAPPQGGPGSGKAAWAAYAEANGVSVPAEATRDEIIEACEAAGVSIG